MPFHGRYGSPDASTSNVELHHHVDAFVTKAIVDVVELCSLEPYTEVPGLQHYI